MRKLPLVYLVMWPTPFYKHRVCYDHFQEGLVRILSPGNNATLANHLREETSFCWVYSEGQRTCHPNICCVVKLMILTCRCLKNRKCMQRISLKSIDILKSDPLKGA